MDILDTIGGCELTLSKPSLAVMYADRQVRAGSISLQNPESIQKDVDLIVVHISRTAAETLVAQIAMETSV